MARPTVWIDNDLTNVNIKAVHVNNYRDFLVYLQNDFCYSHNVTYNNSVNTVDDTADRITVNSTYRITVYTSKLYPVNSINCSSVRSADGGN